MDTITVDIGNRITCTYSYLNYKYDSLLRQDVKNGRITLQEYAKSPSVRSKYKFPGAYSNYFFYIDFPQTVITIADVSYGTDKFIYEEKKEKLEWIIQNDTSRLNGFICQKAIVDFRGRSYIAWFTPEVPVSCGPYKFYGLPGLIVKLSDTKDNFIYELTEIIKPAGWTKYISLDRTGLISTTRKEFRKVFAAGFQNRYQQLIEGRNISMSEEGAVKIREALSRPLPYNPIELE